MWQAVTHDGTAARLQHHSDLKRRTTVPSRVSRKVAPHAIHSEGGVQYDVGVGPCGAGDIEQQVLATRPRPNDSPTSKVCRRMCWDPKVAVQQLLADQ
jgi:hypothetical protein